jgi:Mg2+-importing ATPase
MIVHIIRTPKMAFIESRAAAPLIAATVAIMAIGIFLPMGPLAGYFKMQALPWSFFIWLFGIVVGYAALTSLMKRYYIRRFGWN